MRVKVRKKPAPAVECGERSFKALKNCIAEYGIPSTVTVDIPFLDSDISSYCNHRNNGLHQKSIADVYDVNSEDKLVTAIG